MSQIRKQIAARVVAHSVNAQGIELITVETLGPKFLDAEFRTHRMFGQSSSSDRAIPTKRAVDTDPYLPTDIRVAGKGMQQAQQVDGAVYDNFRFATEVLWAKAVDIATRFSEEVHKQHTNRLLMFASWQKKILTATRDQWDYFFSLRQGYDPDPNMQAMAFKIRHAIELSTPIKREHSWHLPYILDSEHEAYPVELLARVSGARCARVSFDNLDGSAPNIGKDLASAQQRLDDRHLTPFEHQACVMPSEATLQTPGITHMDREGRLWSAQFRGWIQYRKLMDGTAHG